MPSQTSDTPGRTAAEKSKTSQAVIEPHNAPDGMQAFPQTSLAQASYTGVSPQNLILAVPHLKAASRSATDRTDNHDDAIAKEELATATLSELGVNETLLDSLAEGDESEVPQTGFEAVLQKKVNAEIDKWTEFEKRGKNRPQLDRQQIKQLEKLIAEQSIYTSDSAALRLIAVAIKEITTITNAQWEKLAAPEYSRLIEQLNTVGGWLAQASADINQIMSLNNPQYWQQFKDTATQEIFQLTAEYLLTSDTQNSLSPEDKKAAETYVEAVYNSASIATKSFAQTILELKFEDLRHHMASLAKTAYSPMKEQIKTLDNYLDVGREVVPFSANAPTLVKKTPKPDDVYLDLLQVFQHSKIALLATVTELKSIKRKVKPYEPTGIKIHNSIESAKKGIRHFGTELADEPIEILIRASTSFDRLANNTIAYFTPLVKTVFRKSRIAMNVHTPANKLDASDDDLLRMYALISAAPLGMLNATQSIQEVTTNLLNIASLAEKNSSSRKGVFGQPNTSADAQVNGQPEPFFEEDDKLKHAVSQALQHVLGTMYADQTKESIKLSNKIKDRKEVTDSLNNAISNAHKIAALVETNASEDAVTADLKKTISFIPASRHPEGKARLLRLEDSLRPAVVELMTATAKLKNITYPIDTSRFDAEYIVLTCRKVLQLAARVKDRIKLATTDLTGAPLNNYSRLGILAKDIGQVITEEKKAYLKDYPDNPDKHKEVDEAVDKMLRRLQGNFTSDKDPDAVVLGKWMDLALHDAENDFLYWPETIEQVLAQFPKISDYLHQWGEKKVAYNSIVGAMAGCLKNGHEALDRLTSISPRKNYLWPRLRYFKIIFAPLIIMWGIRKLKKGTRPGQDPTLAIEDFVGREVQKLAFRIVTSVLPRGFNTALAGAFFLHGLYKGGENRSKFLERVKKRAMGDIVFAGLEQPFLKYSANRKEAVSALKTEIRKLQEAAEATKSVPLRDSAPISTAVKTKDQGSIKPPLISHPAASIAPPNAQPLYMNDELPQGDEPAYGVGTEPAENTVPALVTPAPPLQNQETVEFPEYEEQERLKRSIQALKQNNLQLSSKINANDATSARIRYTEGPADYAQGHTYLPRKKVIERRNTTRRLKADNANFQKNIHKNNNDIKDLEVKIKNLEPKAQEQRELVDLRSAYITHIKEGLRLQALRSKHGKKLKKVQSELKKLKEAMKGASSKHARTAGNTLAGLLKVQADLERRLRGNHGNSTRNTNRAYEIYTKYRSKLQAYRLKNSLSDRVADPLENDSSMTLSSNEILDMTARQSKPVDKDDESIKSYIGNTIMTVIANKVGVEDAAKVKLSDSFVVNTEMRGPTAPMGNGGANFTVTPNYLSLTDVALGNPWRAESTFVTGSTRVHSIAPNQEGTPASVVAALKSGDIRNGIEQKFSSDLGALKDNDVAKMKYGAYAKQQTSIILLANMQGSSNSEKYRISKLAWDGYLEPQPFKFKGKVLAGVIAYGTEDKMLLVSYEHNTSFIYTKNDENKLMWQFISSHLSVFDLLAATASDKFSPKASIGLAGIEDYLTDPRIGIGETSEWEAALWAAKIEQMKSNLDGFVYTTSEHSSDRKIAYTKSLLQFAEFATLILLLGVPTVPQTLLGIFFGLGFAAAGEVVERINMANTDQGDSYKSSEESIEIGRILLAIGVLPEVWMGRKVLINTVGNTSTRLSNIYNKVSKLAKERVAARKLTPKQKSVLSAKHGAADASFKNRISPGSTSRQGAVLNLQVETGVITPEVAAAQGVSADTFLSGSSKKIENATQFIDMTPGSRMSIRDADNNVIFTGINLGEGKVAGINNTLINPEQSDSWVTIDLSDADILTHSENGWTLKSSNTPIKIVTEVETPDVNLNNTTLSAANDTESMPPLTRQATVTQLPTTETPIPLGTSVVTDLDDPLKSSMATMLDKLKVEPAIKLAMNPPFGTVSRNFLQNVRARLLESDIGMTDIQYRVVYFWSESDQHTYMRHIVITGEKDGQRYVLDLSGKRLATLNIAAIDDPFILTEAQWLEKYRSFDGDLMIKYLDTSSPTLASHRFNPLTPPSLSGYNVNSTINLTEPTWFKTLISPAYVTDTASSMANLTTEESVLFKALSDTLTKRSVDSKSKYISRLLNKPKPITTGEQLSSIPASQVVVISDGDLHHHVLLSLGNGKFAAHRLDEVDSSLPRSNGIITAETLKQKMVQGKIGKFSLASGEINKAELTFESFLGKGSKITKGANNVITIEMIRSPGADDPLYTFLSMSPLEHLWNARGLLLKTDATFGIAVTYVVSSYVERDNEPPIVQALSNFLDSEVTHHNIRNNQTTTYLPQAQNPE